MPLGNVQVMKIEQNMALFLSKKYQNWPGPPDYSLEGSKKSSSLSSNTNPSESMDLLGFHTNLSDAFKKIQLHEDFGDSFSEEADIIE